MRNRLSIGLAAAAAAVALATLLPAQQNGGGLNGLPEGFQIQDQGAKGAKGGKGKGKAKAPSRPTPRLANGKVNFGPLPGEKGVWQGGAGSTLTTTQAPGSIDNILVNAPINMNINDVPFQPWARELYNHRRATLTADDPHVRCKSSGGARLYHTPYGFEVIQVDDMQRIFLAGVGGPHTYRTVYMDGRPHPANLEPSYHGHSIGWWEGDDKLVVDSVGFHTRFWLAREGYPHTNELHTIETFERPNHDTLRYTITIDDPGAYTARWSGGWAINWGANAEMYEFICQENNRDSRHMFGGDTAQ